MISKQNLIKLTCNPMWWCETQSLFWSGRQGWEVCSLFQTDKLPVDGRTGLQSRVFLSPECSRRSHLWRCKDGAVDSAVPATLTWLLSNTTLLWCALHKWQTLPWKKDILQTDFVNNSTSVSLETHHSSGVTQPSLAERTASPFQMFQPPFAQKSHSS